MPIKLNPAASAVLALCAGAALLSGCGGADNADSATAAARKVMGGAVKQAAPTSSTASNGVSTVAFSGIASRYTITASGDKYTVTDTEGSDGATTVTRTQRLQFADTNISLDVDGIPGKAFRLYQAALNRTPDAGGLGFWISMLDNGVAMSAVSAAFISSTEFKDLFGANLSNSQYVTAFYLNVLHRAPEQGGFDFWLSVLNQKLAPLEDVLAAFASSQENYDAVLPTIVNGIRYTPMTRVAIDTVPGAPTAATATAGNGAATIAFTAPASNGGKAITAYTATCSGNGASKSATGADSPLLVSGLTNNVLYTCSVSATNALGRGAASASVTVTPVEPNLPPATVPGAPTIGAATAGNGSASIAFTAPASNGGAAITGYTASCTGGGGTRTGSGAASPISVTGLSNGTAYSCSVTAANAAGTSAASAAVSVTPSSGSSGDSTSTASLFCNYSNSTTNPTTGMASTVATTCTGTQRKLTGNGVPDHEVGAFPNSGNPNTIGAVSVNFTGSTAPAVVSTTGTAVAHILGFALNGVKFDPSTAESYQNAGVWKIEALNQTYFKFGTDVNNAHVQPDGAYHYHGMPEKYITKLGKGTGMVLVGFAVDGFPMYARYGYTVATDATSGTKVMTSSYRLKTTASAGRPSTSIAAMGTFTQDYEYVAGLGDLDECNGRTGVTPEFPNGIYHYYITDTYPFIQRCVKGTAASTTGAR
ncbi:YHYH protein [Pseudoduganella sp. OTU4001]|uniref:YHYH protein n=1 Tax=Pseudoduganella sp. OTU4001 TaxID=3043854 RepID=UPI00313B2952